MEPGKYLVIKKRTSPTEEGEELIRNVVEISISKKTDKCYYIYESLKFSSPFYWILIEDFDKQFEFVEKIIEVEQSKKKK